MKKILFVINDAGYFFSHRFALAKAAQEAGYGIHVAVPHVTETVHEQFHNARMHPHSFNNEQKTIKELQGICELNGIVKKIQPDLVHLVTLKSSLRWFFLLPFVHKIPSVHTIAGFGQLSGTDFVARTGKWVMKAILAFQSRLSKSLYVVQNPDDGADLCRQHIIAPDRLFLVQGSGVDTIRYAPSKKAAEEILHVGTAARRLRAKGIPALLDVARVIKARNLPIAIHIASIPSPGHREAVDEAQWQTALADGLFIDEGAVTNMPAYYARLDTFIYLSTSGEGLAKTLLEAASCALPVITTFQPGCKEAVIPNKTGYLVRPQDTELIVKRLTELQSDKAMRDAMGKASRQYVMGHFTNEIVVKRMLELYDKAINL